MTITTITNNILQNSCLCGKITEAHAKEIEAEIKSQIADLLSEIEGGIKEYNIDRITGSTMVQVGYDECRDKVLNIIKSKKI